MAIICIIGGGRRRIAAHLGQVQHALGVDQVASLLDGEGELRQVEQQQFEDSLAGETRYRCHCHTTPHCTVPGKVEPLPPAGQGQLGRNGRRRQS